MSNFPALLDAKRRTLTRLGRRDDHLATMFDDVDPGVEIPCSHCGHDCRGVLTDCGATCTECGRFTVYRYWFPRRSFAGGAFDRCGAWPVRALRRAYEVITT